MPFNFLLRPWVLSNFMASFFYINLRGKEKTVKTHEVLQSRPTVPKFIRYAYTKYQPNVAVAAVCNLSMIVSPTVTLRKRKQTTSVLRTPYVLPAIEITSNLVMWCGGGAGGCGGLVVG